LAPNVRVDAAARIKAPTAAPSKLREAVPPLASNGTMKLLGCELIMRPIAPPAQDLSYRHKVEDGAFWILEAQIRTEAPKGNSRCAKRGLGNGRIGNAQGHVVGRAHRLVAFGLKQRHLRAVVPNADERHGLRLVLNLQTQDVAKPGDRARQIAIPNANVIDASAVKECHQVLHSMNA